MSIPGKIVDIDREIEVLDKDKKNYCRRINYKIKKLRSERSRLLGEESRGQELRTEHCIQKNTPPPRVPHSSKTIVPFELVRGVNQYDRFVENKWEEVPFLDLEPDDIMRVRTDGRVMEIKGATVFRVLSLPYSNSEFRHSIKVQHDPRPLRNLREEITSRLKPSEVSSSEPPAPDSDS